MAVVAVGRDSSVLVGSKAPSVIDGSPDAMSKEAAAEDFLEPRVVIEPLCVLRLSAGGGAKSSAVTPLPICWLPRREVGYDIIGG